MSPRTREFEQASRPATSRDMATRREAESLAAALDQMWAYRGPSLTQWDMVFGEMVEKQRRSLSSHVRRLDES
eukprot:4728317-Prymnesium_polylepis.1